MKTNLVLTVCAGLLVGPYIAHSSRADDTVAEQEVEVKMRRFQFDYAATLKGLPQGTSARVWLPVPQSSQHQEVRELEQVLPAEPITTTEPKYGNKILYFKVKSPDSGDIAFRTSYLVTRHEARGASGDGSNRVKLTDAQRRKFLSANARVPVEGKPLELLSGITLPDNELGLARTLYERVDEHVRYDKSQPGYGQGDVLWVCDSRFGNCTDFHSLFISLARSQGLPARFEIGFPLPPERGEGQVGGYHCWALFHTESNGWVPVDISEADKHPEMKEYYFGNLTEDRVTFSVGRDISLRPRQAGPPLNFFVYPYIEVDGEPLGKDRIELAFRYQDLEEE
jgi:transglutaminase-like putative cysteine protease